MERTDLNQTAKSLVAEGKGILAADETVPTLNKRFASLKIETTEDSGRTIMSASAAKSGDGVKALGNDDELVLSHDRSINNLIHHSHLERTP